MRIRRIEITGFKSFADPTKIVLGPGVTAIVGPNGCGKSNIVDAIRWVLGEHSARQLRGGVMEDLIFQGSETRPPAAYCEVELVLEPGEAGFPPPYEELSELRLTRRLARDGRMDARINGKAVRVRDLTDLFLDTGASARAYAVLEQGMVARLVTARPEERRAFLEEAAGVARYRARKRETELKLARVREQLTRIRDLHVEVGSRLRSLRQQAARAERFRAMQRELEGLQALLARAEVEEARAREEKARLELARAERAFEEARARLAHAEREREQRAQALDALERERTELEDALRGLERERAELHRRIERHEAELRVMAERAAQLERQKAAEEEELARGREALARRREELAGTDAARAEEALARARAARARLEQELEALRGRRDDLYAAWQQERARIETSRERRGELERRLQETAARRQELEARLRREEEASRETAQAEEEAGRAVDEARRRLDALRGEAGRMRQEAEEAERAALAAREALAGLERELRALEAEHERATLAARPAPDADAWLARARQAGGKPLEALSMPEGLEAAVAAAAGREIAVAWRTHPPAWRELVDEARALGAAAFVGPREGDGSVRPNGATTLAEALGLDAEDPWHAPFARVVLVEDARAAPDGAGAVCVDREGRRRDPHGGVVAAAPGRLADRLRAARKAEALAPRVADLRKRLEAAREEAEARTRQAREAEAEARAKVRALGEAERALHEAEGRLARAEHALAAARERTERVREELAALGEAETRLRKELAGAREGGDGAEAEARARLEEAERAIGALEARLAEAREEERAAERAHLAETERARALEAECAALEQALKARRARIGALEAELAEAGRALERLRADPPDREALLGLDARAEEMQARMQELRAGHARARAELAEAEQEVRRAQKEAAQAEARVHAQQGELAHARERFAEAQGRAQAFRDAGTVADMEPAEARARAAELEARIASFGAVNLLALEEHEETEQRERFLREQIEDLEKSAAGLEETMRRMDREVRRRFAEVFEAVDAQFRELFPRLFGGGRARLELTGEDALTAGVAVVAEPPGKRLQDVALLSGGEKALTALALMFALFRVRPAPFCVLDEVDAPLDDANVGRFAGLVREHAAEVQFLAITHNKITMQHADRLLGVSMPEAGVSRIVAVSLEDWEEA